MTASQTRLGVRRGALSERFLDALGDVVGAKLSVDLGDWTEAVARLELAIVECEALRGELLDGRGGVV